MRIEYADSPQFLGTIRALFCEYESSINVDLCFQGFEKELATVPGEYARPRGRLLLAFDGDEVAGCGALRRFDEGISEMKRLYVRPAYRGKSIGAELARVLIENAREASYAKMRLDTMPSMARAIVLYRSLGFREIPCYRFNPVPGALFFELDL